MSDWYSTVYKAFIFAGVISFILGLFTDSNTSLGAYIAGYSILLLAILMILIILFNNILNVNSNISTVQQLYSILIATGPFILIVGIIAFVLYLLVKYQSNIANGETAPGYNSFSNIIVILLLIQIYLIYSNMDTEKFKITGTLSKVTSSIIYFIGVITAICSIILYRILKYYSTDGFSNEFTQLSNF
jgi:hypothetical protein